MTSLPWHSASLDCWVCLSEFAALLFPVFHWFFSCVCCWGWWASFSHTDTVASVSTATGYIYWICLVLSSVSHCSTAAASFLGGPCPKSPVVTEQNLVSVCPDSCTCRMVHRMVSVCGFLISVSDWSVSWRNTFKQQQNEGTIWTDAAGWV